MAHPNQTMRLPLFSLVSRVATPLSLLTILAATSCAVNPVELENLDPGERLDFGDAEWDPAPFDPPGIGEANPDEATVDEDNVADPNVAPVADLPVDSIGDDWDEDASEEEAPQTVALTEPTEEEVQTEVVAEDTSTGSIDPQYTCDEQMSVDSCDQNIGVCETIGEVDGLDPVELTPCCTDPDCACVDGACDNLPCQADDVCDCGCPSGLDPDCGEGSCTAADAGAQGDAVCPESRESFTLYMSNDDSNSQASPILARSLIAEGQIVPKSAIRIHEFMNYYTMDRPHSGENLVDVGVEMRRVPGTEDQFTMLAAAQAPKITREERVPYNLVFSLDTSGSMAGKPIEMLVASVRAMAKNLKKGDIISLVEWSATSTAFLDGHEVSGPNDPVLMDVINNLSEGGGTDLHGGLTHAYELAESHYRPDRVNRVVIISDGGANAGITDISTIADAADSHDGNGIYLVGVGVGFANTYDDELMNEVTDAGKGAYIFIDSAEEAELMFGDKFLSNTAVAARNVRLSVTLPWYFGVKEFHGEQLSLSPEKVDPQHLAPNDATTVHSILAACDPTSMFTNDEVVARVTYEHPTTNEAMDTEYTTTMGELVQSDIVRLRKSDVIVSYAKALVNIADIANGSSGQGRADAQKLATAMQEWLETGADALDDPEVREMAQTMADYVNILSPAR